MSLHVARLSALSFWCSHDSRQSERLANVAGSSALALPDTAPALATPDLPGSVCFISAGSHANRKNSGTMNSARIMTNLGE